MKKRSLIAKCLTLAMVFALMIPAPVAAKAKAAKGGKLVKTVTEYSYQTSGRWQAEYKTTYEYDKKDNPVVFNTIKYTQHFLSVPFAGTKSVETAKYKYKGKSPKLMKIKDGAGKVRQTRKYKKGRVVSITGSDKSSWESTAWEGNNRVFKGDNTYVESFRSNIKYNKKGLATSEVSTSSYNNSSVTEGASSGASTYNSTYAVTQKKGIPSYILESSSYGDSDTDKNGTRSYQRNADGTYTEVYTDGTSESGKRDAIAYYTKFNKKGLAVEGGSIRTDATTGVQVVEPSYTIAYKTKKGVVTQAIVNYLETDYNTGAVTKSTPTRMYKFKYMKTKTTKARYFNMVNELIDIYNTDEEILSEHSFFAWY